MTLDDEKGRPRLEGGPGDEQLGGGYVASSIRREGGR